MAVDANVLLITIRQEVEGKNTRKAVSQGFDSCLDYCRCQYNYIDRSTSSS